ncbi:hypothetical protein LTR53_019702, partial [Teratosphaeriaceae sp. CCFEE 6253]
DGEGVVEGDEAEDNEAVGQEEEDGFFHFEAGPERDSRLGAGGDDPGPALEGEGVHDPEVEGRQRDGEERAREPQVDEELICQRPQDPEEGPRPDDDQAE